MPVVAGEGADDEGQQISDSIPSAIDTQIEEEMDDWISHFIHQIGPSPCSENLRRSIFAYVRYLILDTIERDPSSAHSHVAVFRYGSLPLMTYLPDGDIDVGFITYKSNGVIEEDSKAEHYLDLSIGGCSSFVFLDLIDRRLLNFHLFKRSLLLIKSWCAYESHTLGSRNGLMATYAVETLALCVFHMFGGKLKTPLQVFAAFLEYFSDFDWNSSAVTVCGPISLQRLKEISDPQFLQDQIPPPPPPPPPPELRHLEAGGREETSSGDGGRGAEGEHEEKQKGNGTGVEGKEIRDISSKDGRATPLPQANGGTGVVSASVSGCALLGDPRAEREAVAEAWGGSGASSSSSSSFGVWGEREGNDGTAVQGEGEQVVEMNKGGEREEAQRRETEKEANHIGAAVGGEGVEMAVGGEKKQKKKKRNRGPSRREMETVEFVEECRARFCRAYRYFCAPANRGGLRGPTGGPGAMKQMRGVGGRVGPVMGFAFKNLNVVDPLNNLNNLGRSVSPSSFYRSVGSGCPASLCRVFPNSLRLLQGLSFDVDPFIQLAPVNHPETLRNQGLDCGGMERESDDLHSHSCRGKEKDKDRELLHSSRGASSLSSPDSPSVGAGTGTGRVGASEFVCSAGAERGERERVSVVSSEGGTHMTGECVSDRPQTHAETFSSSSVRWNNLGVLEFYRPATASGAGGWEVGRKVATRRAAVRDEEGGEEGEGDPDNTFQPPPITAYRMDPTIYAHPYPYIEALSHPQDGNVFMSPPMMQRQRLELERSKFFCSDAIEVSHQLELCRLLHLPWQPSITTPDDSFRLPEVLNRISRFLNFAASAPEDHTLLLQAAVPTHSMHPPPHPLMFHMQQQMAASQGMLPHFPAPHPLSSPMSMHMHITHAFTHPRTQHGGSMMPPSVHGYSPALSGGQFEHHRRAQAGQGPVPSLDRVFAGHPNSQLPPSHPPPQPHQHQHPQTAHPLEGEIDGGGIGEYLDVATGPNGPMQPYAGAPSLQDRRGPPPPFTPLPPLAGPGGIHPPAPHIQSPSGPFPPSDLPTHLPPPYHSHQDGPTVQTPNGHFKQRRLPLHHPETTQTEEGEVSVSVSAQVNTTSTKSLHPSRAPVSTSQSTQQHMQPPSRPPSRHSPSDGNSAGAREGGGTNSSVPGSSGPGGKNQQSGPTAPTSGPGPGGQKGQQQAQRFQPKQKGGGSSESGNSTATREREKDGAGGGTASGGRTGQQQGKGEGTSRPSGLAGGTGGGGSGGMSVHMLEGGADTYVSCSPPSSSSLCAPSSPRGRGGGGVAVTECVPAVAGLKGEVQSVGGEGEEEGNIDSSLAQNDRKGLGCEGSGAVLLLRENHLKESLKSESLAQQELVEMERTERDDAGSMSQQSTALSGVGKKKKKHKNKPLEAAKDFNYENSIYSPPTLLTAPLQPGAHSSLEPNRPCLAGVSSSVNAGAPSCPSSIALPHAVEASVYEEDAANQGTHPIQSIHSGPREVEGGDTGNSSDDAVTVMSAHSHRNHPNPPPHFSLDPMHQPMQSHEDRGQPPPPPPQILPSTSIGSQPPHINPHGSFSDPSLPLFPPPNYVPQQYPLSAFPPPPPADASSSSSSSAAHQPQLLSASAHMAPLPGPPLGESSASVARVPQDPSDHPVAPSSSSSSSSSFHMNAESCAFFPSVQTLERWKKSCNADLERSAAVACESLEREKSLVAGAAAGVETAEPKRSFEAIHAHLFVRQTADPVKVPFPVSSQTAPYPASHPGSSPFAETLCYPAPVPLSFSPDTRKEGENDERAAAKSLQASHYTSVGPLEERREARLGSTVSGSEGVQKKAEEVQSVFPNKSSAPLPNLCGEQTVSAAASDPHPPCVDRNSLQEFVKEESERGREEENERQGSLASLGGFLDGADERRKRHDVGGDYESEAHGARGSASLEEAEERGVCRAPSASVGPKKALPFPHGPLLGSLSSLSPLRSCLSVRRNSPSASSSPSSSSMKTAPTYRRRAASECSVLSHLSPRGRTEASPSPLSDRSRKSVCRRRDRNLQREGAEERTRERERETATESPPTGLQPSKRDARLMISSRTYPSGSSGRVRRDPRDSRDRGGFGVREDDKELSSHDAASVSLGRTETGEEKEKSASLLGKGVEAEDRFFLLSTGTGTGTGTPSVGPVPTGTHTSTPSSPSFSSPLHHPHHLTAGRSGAGANPEGESRFVFKTPSCSSSGVLVRQRQGAPCALHAQRRSSPSLSADFPLSSSSASGSSRTLMRERVASLPPLHPPLPKSNSLSETVSATGSLVTSAAAAAAISAENSGGLFIAPPLLFRSSSSATTEEVGPSGLSRGSFLKGERRDTRGGGHGLKMVRNSWPNTSSVPLISAEDSIASSSSVFVSSSLCEKERGKEKHREKEKPLLATPSSVLRLPEKEREAARETPPSGAPFAPPLRPTPFSSVVSTPPLAHSSSSSSSFKLSQRMGGGREHVHLSGLVLSSSTGEKGGEGEPLIGGRLLQFPFNDDMASASSLFVVDQRAGGGGVQRTRERDVSGLLLRSGGGKRGERRERLGSAQSGGSAKGLLSSSGGLLTKSASSVNEMKEIQSRLVLFQQSQSQPTSGAASSSHQSMQQERREQHSIQGLPGTERDSTGNQAKAKPKFPEFTSGYIRPIAEREKCSSSQREWGTGGTLRQSFAVRSSGGEMSEWPIGGVAQAASERSVPLGKRRGGRRDHLLSLPLSAVNAHTGSAEGISMNLSSDALFAGGSLTRGAISASASAGPVQRCTSSIATPCGSRSNLAVKCKHSQAQTGGTGEGRSQSQSQLLTRSSSRAGGPPHSLASSSLRFELEGPGGGGLRGMGSRSLRTDESLAGLLGDPRLGSASSSIAGGASFHRYSHTLGGGRCEAGDDDDEEEGSVSGVSIISYPTVSRDAGSILPILDLPDGPMLRAAAAGGWQLMPEGISARDWVLMMKEANEMLKKSASSSSSATAGTAGGAGGTQAGQTRGGLGSSGSRMGPGGGPRGGAHQQQQQHQAPTGPPPLIDDLIEENRQEWGLLPLNLPGPRRSEGAFARTGGDTPHRSSRSVRTSASLGQSVLDSLGGSLNIEPGERVGRRHRMYRKPKRGKGKQGEESSSSKANRETTAEAEGVSSQSLSLSFLQSGGRPQSASLGLGGCGGTPVSPAASTASIDCAASDCPRGHRQKRTPNSCPRWSSSRTREGMGGECLETSARVSESLTGSSHLKSGGQKGKGKGMWHLRFEAFGTGGFMKTDGKQSKWFRRSFHTDHDERASLPSDIDLHLAHVSLEFAPSSRLPHSQQGGSRLLSLRGKGRRREGDSAFHVFKGRAYPGDLDRSDYDAPPYKVPFQSASQQTRGVSVEGEGGEEDREADAGAVLHETFLRTQETEEGDGKVSSQIPPVSNDNDKERERDEVPQVAKSPVEDGDKEKEPEEKAVSEDPVAGSGGKSRGSRKSRKTRQKKSAAAAAAVAETEMEKEKETPESQKEENGVTSVPVSPPDHSAQPPGDPPSVFPRSPDSRLCRWAPKKVSDLKEAKTVDDASCNGHRFAVESGEVACSLSKETDGPNLVPSGNCSVSGSAPPVSTKGIPVSISEGGSGERARGCVDETQSTTKAD
uniref:PAP/OAS1 substrate-binding-related domain-containing protein n=1 Tax=Chromera velia CCMP2878 TaxID=1169474 RepID=A0A0K6S744_9ALVE|eukprot:Cvel_19599.t1-p1 / transcript=Cvel_19599.t1 / gene=Cvel_19599 / organism=Chromera_velia_CCMP2878 / gene_product=hypothetical protein / transcript_product=hypothetical protein / location=Cvel_scaffold1703:18233-34057(+) / protein_length=3586 / sequence_SO=supercontig / SO=protein_coding / is_pseudo=false